MAGRDDVRAGQALRFDLRRAVAGRSAAAAGGRRRIARRLADGGPGRGRSAGVAVARTLSERGGRGPQTEGGTLVVRPAGRDVNRFAPTRAGVINLWDYRDEEFVFADGRLVLRGPNGSGKTKALEVLFPFVLDGRIDPRRLNPF